MGRVRNHLPIVGPFGGEHNISTHLHGSESAPQYDGYAADITRVGYYKDYHYPNSQVARALWYYDHGQHWTAQNVYSGLAAHYHLHDDVERDLLPQGEFDVPITVSDAIFNADGSLGYNDRSHFGLWGDVILVNGRPRGDEGQAAHLSLPHSRRQPRRVLPVAAEQRHAAADRGPRRRSPPQGVTVSTFRHGSSECYEVVLDFSAVPAGTQVELLNSSNNNNVDFDRGPACIT